MTDTVVPAPIRLWIETSPRSCDTIYQDTYPVLKSLPGWKAERARAKEIRAWCLSQYLER